jgi:ketosteroid isomerase-like protein
MNNPIDTIKAAERQLAAAHLTLDLDTIDRLLHPDYLILQPDGRFETKADVLASYRSGDRHWDTADVDQLDVRLYGSAAIVTGRWQATGVNSGQPFAYAAHFISTWLYEDSRWQNIAYQSSEIS